MLNHGHSSEAGFTIVEAVVAGLILVIGILGSVSVFDSSRRESGTGERLQVAQARAEAELERMRDIPYDELATDSAQSWEASGDPGDPADRVSSGSAPTVQISAESDEELVLASGGAGISPYSSQEELAVEGVSYTMSVYRFVSWRDVECQVIELSGLRSQLNGTINALLTRAQSVNTRSGALITKYTGLLLTLLPIGGLKSELQALQTEVGELQAKLNALLSAVNDLSELDPCDADIETLNEINDTLVTLGPALDTLDGALLSAQGANACTLIPLSCPSGTSTLYGTAKNQSKAFRDADWTGELDGVLTSLGEVSSDDHAHNTKRVTVAVVLDPVDGSGPFKPVWATSIVADPDAEVLAG